MKKGIIKKLFSLTLSLKDSKTFSLKVNMLVRLQPNEHGHELTVVGTE